MVRNISIHSWAATGRPFKNFSPYWNRSEVPCISIGRHAPILATKIHREERKRATISSPYISAPCFPGPPFRPLDDPENEIPGRSFLTYSCQILQSCRDLSTFIRETLENTRISEAFGLLIVSVNFLEDSA